MRYYKPDLQLGILISEQTQLVDKFGGLPWGFPQELWPVCANCGSRMVHLMQLQHHPERLDLGAPGRVLLVFMCGYMLEKGCDTFDADAGANKVLILEPPQITTGLTPLPDPSIAAETEAFVNEWVPHEDPVSEEQFIMLFDDETCFNLSQEITTEIYIGNKLGGAPFWYQGASESPPPPYRFVGEFDSEYVFYTDVNWEEYEQQNDLSNSHKDVLSQILMQNDGGYTCPTNMYGYDGLAYLFIDPRLEAPSGKFFWQR